jgi:hypothetical protein
MIFIFDFPKVITKVIEITLTNLHGHVLRSMPVNNLEHARVICYNINVSNKEMRYKL